MVNSKIIFLKGTKIAKKMGGTKLTSRNEEENPGIAGN